MIKYVKLLKVTFQNLVGCKHCSIFGACDAITASSFSVMVLLSTHLTSRWEVKGKQVTVDGGQVVSSVLVEGGGEGSDLHGFPYFPVPVGGWTVTP